MRRLLLSLGCALILGGALALFWYAYIQVDMVRTEKEASRAIATKLPARPVPRTIVIPAPRPGDPLGRIEIPRLHLSAPVLEGTSARTLRTAAGHIRGTALPGTSGNVGIAAHRDTLFRALNRVKPGDEIAVATSYGRYRYIAGSSEIVNPGDVGVLRNTPEPELTLITCYPFYYLGPAPKRFVPHARQLPVARSKL